MINTIQKRKRTLSVSPIEIMQLLHSTLDVTEILNNFTYYLKAQFRFSSLTYQHQEICDEYHFGEERKNQFIFNLATEKVNLGKIIISRDETFSEDDIAQLEELLCFLIQPLKNAITHYKMIHASLHDHLTNLLNRSSLDANIQREIKRCKRDKSPLSIIILDIDNFKKINDIHGHIAGDQVLMQLASIILKTMRETDYAFRIGGEEFLLLLNNTSLNDGKKLAERLRKEVESSVVNFEDKTITFTVSLGLSNFKVTDTQQSLIAKADKAMYTAKMSGKNQVITS